MARPRNGRSISEDEGQGQNLTPPVSNQKLEQAELEQLRNKSLDEVMREGHEALLRLLVAKVKSGTASHQEQAILRNILRDNGMVMVVDPVKTIDAEPLDLPQLAPPEYN